MKITHLATVGLLCASAMGSIGAIGLVAHQYTMQRSAVQVVANTAVVERMQGLSDALPHLPTNDQRAAAAGYGFSSAKELDAALIAERHELETAQTARAQELATNDKRLTVLLAALGLNAVIAILSAVALHDLASRQRARTSARPAENSPSSYSLTTIEP